MLVRDKKSGLLVPLEPAIAREFIAAGIAVPARRTTAAFAGGAPVGEPEDGAYVEVLPADTTDVDPRD